MPRYRSSITSLKEDNESAVQSRKSFSTNFRRKVREESILNKKSLKEASNITMNSFFNKNTANLNARELQRFTEYVNEFKGADVEKRTLLIENTRKTISYGNNLPVDEAIASGLVPYIVAGISPDMPYGAIYDALWILTNIASKNEGQSKYLVDLQILPRLNLILESSALDLKDQAIWVIANISGDIGQVRDYIINNNTIPLVIAHLKSGLNNTMASTTVWALSNLCNGTSPRPDFRQVREILPAMGFSIDTAFGNVFSVDRISGQVLGNPYTCSAEEASEPNKDKENNGRMALEVLENSRKEKGEDKKQKEQRHILEGTYDEYGVKQYLPITEIDIIRDTVVTISYILESNGNMDEKILALKSLQPDIIPKLVLLCLSERIINTIKRKVVRIFGIISRSPLLYPDFISKYGIVQTIFKLLACGETALVRDSAWALSNICSFGPNNIKFCVQQGMCELLVRGFNTRSAEIKSELTMIIYNILQKGDIEDILALFDKRLLNTILELIKCRFFNSRKVGLLVVKRLLEKTKYLVKDGIHPYVEMIKELDGIDIIEKSQEESNNQIYNLASEIIIEFFGGEEENPEDQLKNEVI